MAFEGIFSGEVFLARRCVGSNARGRCRFDNIWPARPLTHNPSAINPDESPPAAADAKAFRLHGDLNRPHSPPCPTTLENAPCASIQGGRTSGGCGGRLRSAVKAEIPFTSAARGGESRGFLAKKVVPSQQAGRVPSNRQRGVIFEPTRLRRHVHLSRPTGISSFSEVPSDLGVAGGGEDGEGGVPEFCGVVVYLIVDWDGG
jgi:hypothetical protein